MRKMRIMCGKFLAGLIAMGCVVVGMGNCVLGVTVRPVDDGRVLMNPNMGWTMHYYSNAPVNYGSFLKPGDSCEWFPGCSIVYLRLPWACLEPEEGVYNWAAIDTPAQRWIERGGQVAFRITCSETWMRFATPEWVKNAGAKGVFYDFGWGKSGKVHPGGKSWDPDFGDPIFLEKLEKFMKAFAARYDGRKEVAFVDVGTYGLWGEGHTHGSSKASEADRQKDLRTHIDLHVKYFKKTMLAISDDIDGYANKSTNHPLLDYARERGVTFRDDSIMVEPPPRSWHHTNQAELYWRTMPTIIEHEHYHSSLKKKAWVPELLLKSVEEYHASYMSIHGKAHDIYNGNKDVIDKINLRLGYRFQLRELTYPDIVKVGGNAETFSINWKWANAGVAPCYQDAFPALTVKSTDGNIIAVLSDENFNLKTLEVAEPNKATPKENTAKFCLGRWAAPVTPAGEYDVYVSVGERDGTPIYELPLPNSDGKKRYKIGKIKFVTQ